MPSYLVLDVHYLNQLTFWSCPECMCKMSECPSSSAKNRLFCESCNDSYSISPEYRKYKLTLTVCELSTREIVIITIFGKSLERLVGCTAHQYHRRFAENSILRNLKESDLSVIMLSMLLGETVEIQGSKRKNIDDSVYNHITGHNLKLAVNKSEETSFLKIILSKYNIGLSVPNRNDSDNGDGFDAKQDKPPDENSCQPVINEACVGATETKEVDNNLTWHDSLIEEFNQSIMTQDLPDNQQATIRNEIKGHKRDRLQVSLTTTPSAPARSKARLGANPPTPTQASTHNSYFSTPLSLPLNFRTPASKTIRQIGTSPLLQSTQSELTDRISVSEPTLCSHDPAFSFSMMEEVISSTPGISRTVRLTEPSNVEESSIDHSKDLFSKSNLSFM